jgi:hypothetical protein
MLMISSQGNYCKLKTNGTYTSLDDPCPDFTNINWIIVSSASLSIRVNKGGIFPSAL